MIEAILTAAGSSGVDWSQAEPGDYVETEGGYFASRMIDENGASYALVTAPKAEGEASGTMPWGYAQDWCAGLTIGGHSDWRLPTFDERIAEYWAFKPLSVANLGSPYGDSDLIDPPTGTHTTSNPWQTKIEAFKSGGAEAFVDNAYWSSTSPSSGRAYFVSFRDGQEYGQETYTNLLVRAVRRVYY